MKRVMNKTLFNYCQKHLRVINSGKLKETPSLKRLVDYGTGFIEHGFFYFDEKDQQQLIERVKLELHIHLFRDSYPDDQSRVSNAKTERNEKVGGLNVSDDFILVNSLDALCLNQLISKNCSVSSLGHFICASEIETIEHPQIILVENLAVMANLSRLNIPIALKNALWLYRGDAQKHQQTGTANQFFRRFKATNQLICFSDFDPAGLQITLTCGATSWLTISSREMVNIELGGDEHEWFNQQKAKNYLTHNAQLTDSIAELFACMNNIQKTLKQEHMLAHFLPLVLYPLI